MPLSGDALTFEIAVEGGIDGDAVLLRTHSKDLAVLGVDVAGGRWAPDDVRLFDRDRHTVRPVEVRVNRRTIEVTVFGGGSAEDAEVAADLARAIAEVGGASVRSPALDEVLLPDDFGARHGRLWAKQFEKDGYERLLERVDGEGRVGLPTLRGVLPIGPRLVAQVRKSADPPGALRDALRKVIYIEHEPLHVGHTTTAPVGDHEVRVGSLARGVPTLLPVGTVHAVALEDGVTTLYVPVDALLDALGSRGAWLTEDHLEVPGLDDVSWAAVVDRVRPAVVTDVLTLAGPRLAEPSPEVAKLEAWTPEALAALDRSAQNALRAGAVVAVLIVAGADGVIEPSELQAFRVWLDEARGRAGPMALLFPNGAADAVALLESTRASKVPVSAMFVTTLSALKSYVSRGARHAYADELRALALAVAHSSAGPGWLSFLKPKVRNVEQAALDTLDAMLARITAA